MQASAVEVCVVKSWIVSQISIALQSVSSARSTASRENDFAFKASAGGYSNGSYPQVWYSPLYSHAAGKLS